MFKSITISICKKINVVLLINILACNAIPTYIKSDFSPLGTRGLMAESVCRHAESISNDGRSSTSSIQDPSKLGSFDLESSSYVTGYGIRQRSFASVKVPVSRGKGSWRRPFSLFLEFYLSGCRIPPS